jgi:hypothetical protein
VFISFPCNKNRGPAILLFGSDQRPKTKVTGRQLVLFFDSQITLRVGAGARELGWALVERLEGLSVVLGLDVGGLLAFLAVLGQLVLGGRRSEGDVNEADLEAVNGLGVDLGAVDLLDVSYLSQETALGEEQRTYLDNLDLQTLDDGVGQLGRGTAV